MIKYILVMLVFASPFFAMLLFPFLGYALIKMVLFYLKKEEYLYHQQVRRVKNYLFTLVFFSPFGCYSIILILNYKKIL